MAKKVLIIDDDKNTVKFLSVALEENGYDASDEALCNRVFDLAKTTDHVLDAAEIHACCAGGGAVPREMSN